jgi:hypothetical protein
MLKVLSTTKSPLDIWMLAGMGMSGRFAGGGVV